jgi:hypothetical protein
MARHYKRKSHASKKHRSLKSLLKKHRSLKKRITKAKKTLKKH